MKDAIKRAVLESQRGASEVPYVVTTDPDGEGMPGVVVAYSEEEAKALGAFEEEGVDFEDVLLSMPQGG